MFVDKVTILVKAGNGGDGAMSFRREKYVPNGGPDGGDGGKGGDIILQVKDSMNTLLDFRFAKCFRASDGGKGEPGNCSGKSGKELVVFVPRGTVVKDAETDKVIVDMFDKDARFVLLKGGFGGKGNQHFANSRAQSPHFSQSGQQTIEHKVILELKTIADVGLIGFPNVGKSTLLSAITDAKPKIANYHFTTLSPNLGVLRAYDKTCVVADIPGLIEGASKGIGLGHQFLRHIERTRLLVHLVDISGCEDREPSKDFLAINKELKDYSGILAERKQIIVLNKIDALSPDSSAIQDFIKFIESQPLYKDCPIFTISAIQHKGLEDFIKKIFEMLQQIPESQGEEVEDWGFDATDTNSIFYNKLGDNVYEVSGGRINELTRRVVLNDETSFAYFQKRLRNDGIMTELRKMGLKNGDTVIMGEIEFEYTE